MRFKFCAEHRDFILNLVKKVTHEEIEFTENEEDEIPVGIYYPTDPDAEFITVEYKKAVILKVEKNQIYIDPVYIANSEEMHELLKDAPAVGYDVEYLIERTNLVSLINQYIKTGEYHEYGKSKNIYKNVRA